MRITMTGLATAALLLSATACSSGDPESKPSGDKTTEKPAGVDRDATAVQPSWRLDLDAVAQPAVKDGVAVVLTKAAGRSLEVVAVDVETGKKLWTRAWSPGGIPSGYSLLPSTFRSSSGKSVTVFSVPPRDLGVVSPTMWRQSLAVVDLKTGKELHRTDPVEVLTPPAQCADEKDACLDLRDRKGGVRLDLDTGKLALDPAGTPEGARNIGDAGLFATSLRPGEKLGVARDGKTLWSKPIGRVMGPTVSSDNGWAFAYDDKADRYVGWMRAALPAESLELAKRGEAFSYDLGVLRLASIDGTDGTVEWSRKGSEHSCLGMNTDAPKARCVFSGVVSYSAAGELTGVENGSATVEGFDPETGKTTWSVPIAKGAVGDAVDDRDQKVAGDDTILVETEGGPRVVDVTTGKTAEPADDEVFACATENTIFQYAMPFYADGKATTRRYGGPLLRACTADGANAPAYTVAALKDGGMSAGKDRYVLTGKGGLFGYEVP